MKLIRVCSVCRVSSHTTWNTYRTRGPWKISRQQLLVGPVEKGRRLKSTKEDEGGQFLVLHCNTLFPDLRNRVSLLRGVYACLEDLPACEDHKGWLVFVWFWTPPDHGFPFAFPFKTTFETPNKKRRRASQTRRAKKPLTDFVSHSMGETKVRIPQDHFPIRFPLQG